VRPLLLAHRGHRAAGPENSLRSVLAACAGEGGLDGAEVDVLVTADGRAVLRHDDRLVDGTPIRCLSLAEARRLLGADADDLPEVGAVLEALDADPRTRRATLDLELKVPGAARALLPLAGRLSRVVFTSFWAGEVLDALALFPGRPAGIAIEDVPVRFVPEGAALLAVSHEVVGEVRTAFPQAPLWAWTVNDEAAAARARAARCAAVIGDDATSLSRWFA
jgi:glycerophosphoryl diester phosphodiesterase